ncbi:hypothetical protein BST81_16165 [Leptolyngbya sp. 'hensonii']|uniref:DUF2808 domain-containing protein n=1 Tax=Leptolyngbya sp. 'hensonii' TaxID=1922337 RepID=UPI00094FC34F|nr:DUF2808 domain-containing protein [Leptolyngbya sp. 'hensonii']OLP17337.1 hypothetical protein BST81_16165 [Leptolyngbya sp. 'hensonii']
MKTIPVVLGTVLLLTLGVTDPIVRKSPAVQLADGTVYFNRPPDLVGASATYKTAYAWNSTYAFTLDLLENAGEPLQRVTITLKDTPDPVRYFLEETRAFARTPDGQTRTLTLEQVTFAPEAQAVTVVFNPPVPPGRTVTIELRPVENPSGGVYLFGVTAFPAGEKTYGQFIGYGRIQINDRDYSRFQGPGFFFR